MKSRKKLLKSKQVYDAGESDSCFLAAMQEITTYHMNNCPQYAEILKARGFLLGSLACFSDLYRLPPLPTLFLKGETLYSRPEKKMVVRATTSGTSGKKSTVALDLNSGLLALGMAIRALRRGGYFSFKPTNYIILGYQPSHRNQTGISKTSLGFTLAAPALHRKYALVDTGDSYRLDLEGLIAALKKYEKQGFPVRLVGLPAYHAMLLRVLKERNIRLRLHPESFLCLGGGWKQFYFEHADKGELYALAQEVLGIQEEHCRDFFGVVEHPVVYCDCKNHHFHVPVYSRVIIRDVRTLEPVPYGEAGILNLLTPVMRSMPLHSIMTDDLAVLHPGTQCGCGNPAPYFEILGRSGLQDIKTCAAGAAQFLTENGGR